MSEIRLSRLDNGLLVASDPMAEVTSLTLGLWAGIGTRHEQPAENGISHLLEHMAFKGTKRRSAQDIAIEIENVGGFLNAYTGREQTAYHARLLAEDLPLGLDILADILQNPLFDEKELALERNVVLQEIGRAEDTPDDIVFDRFQSCLFPDQAMGRSVLGQAEIVAAMPAEALRAYFARHYHADNLLLVAAGKIDHARLCDLAAAAFANLGRGGMPSGEPARPGYGEFREARDLEQVHILIGFPGLSLHDPDHYAQGLLAQILGGGLSSRLFQEIREKRGLVYDIHSFATSWSDSGAFGIYAGTGETQAGEVLPLICDEIAKLAAGIPGAEIARAVAQVKSGLLMAQEKSSSRAESLAGQLRHFGRPLPPAEILQKIATVTEADLIRVLKRLLAGPPSLAAIGPLGEVMGREELARRLAL